MVTEIGLIWTISGSALSGRTAMVTVRVQMELPLLSPVMST